MANIISAEILIKGREKSIDDFCDSILFAECNGIYEEEYSGEKYTRIKGDFNWQVAPEDDANVDLNKLKKEKYEKKDFVKLNKLSMKQRSEVFECLIEVFEYNDAAGYIGHGIYDKGNVIKMEKISIDDLEEFDDTFGVDFSGCFEIIKNG